MNERRPPFGFWATVTIGVILAALPSYLLLLGPLALLSDKGYITNEAYFMVWRPFVVVEEHLPTIVPRMMFSYEAWWRSAFGDSEQ